MYVAFIDTHYKIFSVGQTKEEALKNLLKGYQKEYSKKDRSVDAKNGIELIEYFGGGIHQIKNGYATE